MEHDLYAVRACRLIAQMAPQKAIDLAKSINDLERKNNVLYFIAETQASIDPKQALDAAGLISMYWQTDDAVSISSQACLSMGYEAAFDLTGHMIRSYRQRDNAVSIIAQACSSMGYEAALALAWNIKATI